MKTENLNEEATSTAVYTCPMHPKIRQIGPGNCPVCGMTLEPEEIQQSEDDSEYKYMRTRFYIAAIISLPLLILNMGMHIISYQWLSSFTHGIYFNWFQFILSTPVVLWCGWPFFKRAYLSIKTQNLNMFTLIALGVGIAFIYSAAITLMPKLSSSFFSSRLALDVYFEPAAIITVLVLLGQVMELKARSQTSSAIRQLLDLSPKMARLVINHKTERNIPVTHVKVGDLLHIKPGDKIPVDGVIVNGSGVLDQAMITGEPIPIKKNAGDFVISGTINGTGSFIMRAEKIGADTLLSQIVNMVSKAQRTKAPIQKLADTISHYFVPIVIIIACFTFIGWFVFGPEPKVGYALMASVAVLIIACPCALGLATPMSIMVSTGKGAREGVLIKNAEALEVFAKVDILVVDKTGTLTEGKPTLRTVISLSNKYKKSDILCFAASLEYNSEHPLAEAIIKAAESQNIDIQKCKNFKYIPGKGVTGIIKGIEVILGNDKLMNTLNIQTSFLQKQTKDYRQKGQTIMFIAINRSIAGFITISDALKPDSKSVIKELKRIGIRVIMLTGDNQKTARAIARQVGIEEVKSEVLPQNKYEYIRELQQKGFKVAMAGDGINDAPALAQADVGIAMGHGTDIAMESASITLISGNLTGILKAKRLSKITITNIKQNLFLAFAYNVLAIPIASGVFYPIFGLLLSPVIASAAMALSSVSVIFNSLRLSQVNISKD